MDQPKAWISYSGTTEISDADMALIFPDGVPPDLDANRLGVALKERHGNDVGGYMPTSWEVTIDVEAPNPAWTQDEALFPGEAPSKTICTEAGWGGE